MARRQGFTGGGPSHVLASTRRRRRGGGWGPAWDPTWNPSLVIIDDDDDDDTDTDTDDDTSARMAGNMMMSSSNLVGPNGLGGLSSRPCCAKCAGSSGPLSGITGAVHAIGDITADILTSPIALVAAGGLIFMMVTHAKRGRSNPARRRARRRRSRR